METNKNFNQKSLTETEVWHQTHPVKLLLIGDSEAGKSQLINGYKNKLEEHHEYEAT